MAGLLSSVFCLRAPILHAQSVWNGGGADNNFRTGANWQGGTAPTSGTGTALQFAGTTRLTPDTDSAFTVGSLTFNSGAGAFTLGGSALTLADGGTVTNSSSNPQTLANSGGLTLSGASTWTTNASGNLTVSSAIGGTGSLTLAGRGTLTLTGNNTYSGTTTINDGVLQFGNGGTTGSLPGAIFNYNGGVSFNRSDTLTLTANITGGSGMLVRSGTVVVPSGISVSNGLSVGYLSGDSGTLTIASGASATGSALTVGEQSGATGVVNLAGTVNGGYMVVGQDGTGTLNLTAGSLATTYAYVGWGPNDPGATGTVNVSGGTWTHSDSGGNFIVGYVGNGTLNLSGGTITNDTNGAASIGISSGATGTVNVSGGTWNAPQTIYLGGSDSGGNGGHGTITLTGTGVINVGDGTGEIHFVTDGSSTGTLNFGTGGTGGTLSAGRVTADGPGFVVNLNHTGSATFSPVLQGGLSVVKSGSGTTTLSAVNTYTGPTAINAGTLKVNGSAANSAFTVNSGGTLGGSGLVGPLTIASGGTIAPGNSPGTLSAGATTFAGGGAFTFELNKTAGAAGADPGWDLLSISGALNLTATSSNKFTLNLTSLTLGNVAGNVTDFSSASNYSFTFVATTGGITGFDANAFAVDTSAFPNPFNGTWSVGLTNNSHDLSLNYAGGMSAIPEPSTYAAWAGGVTLALAAWRRRRRNSAGNEVSA